MSKIAMFGGSFNPVHNGHIKLVQKMQNKFSLNKVYVIPTFSTPLKDNTPMLSPEHRFNMCSLAFSGFEDVVVSSMEIARKGRSYTSDTLTQLHKLHPSDELYLITGADSFLQLDLWHCSETVFSLAHILTVSRGEHTADALYAKKKEYENRYKAKISIVEESIALVSSTQIRQAISNNKEFSHLLPENVSDYIKNNGLYNYECK